MKIDELTIKQDLEMISFCDLQITEISKREKILKFQRQDKNYVCDYHYLDFELGKCKKQIDYFSYFKYLLEEEIASKKCQKSANIMQFTIPL